MTTFIFYILPVAILSALSIASRRFYPARDGQLSSAQYRVAKTPPVFWILGFYALWYYGAGGAEIESESASLRFWVMVGLIAGVAGDFFLLFRRLFLPGFTAFALGHILYLYGFATVPWVLPVPVVALVFVPGFIYAPMIIRRTGRKEMLPLVLFYMLLINIMLLTAINASTYAWLSQAAGEAATIWPWGIPGGWIPYCLAIGAGLFAYPMRAGPGIVSCGPFQNAGVWILATYYAGQAFIVWGAMQYPL